MAGACLGLQGSSTQLGLCTRQCSDVRLVILQELQPRRIQATKYKVIEPTLVCPDAIWLLLVPIVHMDRKGGMTGDLMCS